jgi:outer membrane protein OmpA-like peptidoglycan-associated protein/tetratricopeptide (TPR) repeat protein
MRLLHSFKNILFFLFVFLSIQLSAQENKKEIRKLTEQGNEIFLTGNYYGALDLFLKAYQLNPDDPMLAYSIGLCYSNIDQKLLALPYLEKAKKGGVEFPDLNFHLGASYHLAHRFEEAIKLLQSYRMEAEKDQFEEIDQLVANCKVGIELLKTPLDVKITNLGPSVNSKYPDYHPSISADETTLLFISRRDNTTGGLKDIQDNHYFEDIYISNKVNGKWDLAKDLGNGINTESHDGCVGISPDGQELFIYRWSQAKDGDLFVSDLKGTEWTAPRNLGNNINSNLWESDASTTSDKKVLFFTSNRKGGLGKRDIYMARKMPNGEYGLAVNLGPKINTKLDEDAPFMHADGKTLYFSSKGHKSMGGFDIFSCTIDIETGVILTEPVNVGYPINTADDDVFFVWSADNKRAYFASERTGGYGEKDIYVLERKEAAAALVVLKGKITSCDKNTPVSAKIVVTDLATSKVIGNYSSNSSSGNYLVILPAGKNYGLAVESAGYLFYSKNVDIPFLDHYKEIDNNICLERIKVGTKIILRNVFFDIDKATLRSESEGELARLLEILSNNKSMKIQISGHTDSDGNDDHNLKLSDARAHAVVDYLVAKGIDASRLTFKGFGETKPVAANDTPENKQLNRRTEIEITE